MIQFITFLVVYLVSAWLTVKMIEVIASKDPGNDIFTNPLINAGLPFIPFVPLINTLIAFFYVKRCVHVLFNSLLNFFKPDQNEL